MSQCTWAACECEGEYPRVSKDGEEWARLCKSHDFTLTKVLGETNPANMVGAWIKAQGGAERAAQRTLGDKRELTKIIERGVLGGQTWDQAAAVLLPDDMGAPGNVGANGPAVRSAAGVAVNEQRNFPNLNGSQVAVGDDKHRRDGGELAIDDDKIGDTYTERRQDVRMADVPALYRETHERLAVELALNMDDAEAVFARHGHGMEAAAALIENPVFIALLERVTDEVRANGTSFKMKARLQAEELLATSYDMATDPMISAAVRKDLIIWTSKVGGLEPKDGADVKAGGGLTLSITFAGQAPQQVVDGRVPVLIEGNG